MAARPQSPEPNVEGGGPSWPEAGRTTSRRSASTRATAGLRRICSISAELAVSDSALTNQSRLNARPGGTRPGGNGRAARLRSARSSAPVAYARGRAGMERRVTMIGVAWDAEGFPAAAAGAIAIVATKAALAAVSARRRLRTNPGADGREREVDIWRPPGDGADSTARGSDPAVADLTRAR